MRVASSYQPNEKLIGNGLFPAYKRTMELALLLMFAFVNLISLPDIISPHSFTEIALLIMARSIEYGLYVFAIVTITFHLMERRNMRLDDIYAWSPKELSHTSRKFPLSRLEAGFELVVYGIFIAWWNDIIAWPFDSWMDMQTTHFSFSNEWQAVHWTINVVVMLSMLVCIHNLITASWRKLTLGIDLALNCVTLLIVTQIIQFDSFISYAPAAVQVSELSHILSNLETVVYVVLGIISLLCVFTLQSNYKKLVR